MTVRSPHHHHHHHHQHLRLPQPLAHGASLELRLQFQVEPLLALLFVWSRLAFDCWPPRCTPWRQGQRARTPHQRLKSATLAAPGPGYLLHSLPRHCIAAVVVMMVVPRKAVEVTRQMGGQLCE